MDGDLLVDGRAVGPVELAVTRRTRTRGLLGRDGLDGALWIEPVRQVHTFRMRFAIDVAHVTRRGVVTHVSTLPPGRLGRWGWRTRSIIEAEAGSFARWGLDVGARVEARHAQDADTADHDTAHHDTADHDSGE